jgi:predicted transcriptional regulator of viral defense system
VHVIRRRDLAEDSERGRPSLASFVDALQSRGRYTFQRDEAIVALGVSDVAFQAAARRLAAKRRIVAARRGFYVIVPIEYRQAGSPPPSWFVHDLMKFHAHPYYVGLLSAAALHGAAHQQPQEFQVITNTSLRPIVAGQHRIRFFLKWHCFKTPTMEVKTQTGMMRVSTPETTALDLVRYMGAAGHLGNVATVLAELAERIDPKCLVKVVQGEVELSVVQRLGFLLDHVASHEVAGPLAAWLAGKHPRPVPLRPERKPKRMTERDPRWQILVNQRVEAEV